MPSRQLHLPDIGTVVLTKRRTSKNIRISYGSDGQIKVSLPIYASYESGVKFVKKSQDWLHKHRPAELVPIEDGDRIGKAHRVSFIRQGEAIKPTVRVTNTKILVTLPTDLDVTDKEAQATATRGANRALAKESKQLLPMRLDNLASKHGFTYRSVGVKKLTTRWGSCSQDRDILLNIYLMQLPWELIDYVLIHELVHTEHMNHSDRFWQRFEEILPNAKNIRKVLKAHKTVISPIKNN